jgi:hypothetical protein
MKKLHLFLSLFCLLLCTQHNSVGQTVFNSQLYGKNRIQYKKFEWQYVSSQNFEIYFYKGGEEIARMAAGYAEADFARMTDLVGYSPYSKMKIFVYNSVADLQQSNIGMDMQGYSVGGQTKFFKPEVELAFTGDKASFLKELNRSIASGLVFEMMYGGSLKDMLKSAYFLSLPDWFIAGVTQYISEGWTVELDDYMRDMLKYRKMKNIDKLQGKDAQMVGHAIWNYIGEEYGKQSIANILNLTRIVRDSESGVQNTIGVSYSRFSTDWRRFYLNQLNTVKTGHSVASENQRIKSNRKEVIYNHLRLHPTENLIVFSENSNGSYKIKLRNLDKNSETTILKGGYRTTTQAIDFNIPLLTWQGSEQLAVVGYEKGTLKIWTYNLKTKKLRNSVLPFSHIQSLRASDDGSLLVMSAEKNGQNDIYTYNPAENSVKQLTDDIFDDLTPCFLKNSKQIVFTSNRLSDSIALAKKGSLVNITDKFSIFVYEPANKITLKRITNTLSKDVQPLAADEKHILYLSNQRGIVHLFAHDIETGTGKQLTNFESSMMSYDFSKNRLAFSMLYKGSDEIYLLKDFNIQTTSVFSGKTDRQQIIDAREVIALRKKRTEQEKKLPKEQKQDAKNDSTPTMTSNPMNIDTDNYVFDSQTEKPKKRKLLDNYKPSQTEILQRNPESIEISKAQPYKSRFSADNLSISLLIDPRYALVPNKNVLLRGAGLAFESGVMELFENHRFNMGAFVLLNLNTNFYLDYLYLRKRLDYRLRFDRQTFSITGGGQAFLQNYALNKMQASVSYPFNIHQRVTATLLGANTTFAATSNQNTPPSIPEEAIYYGGAGLSYTFDNVLQIAPSVFDGFKGKVSYEHYLGIERGDKSFGNISAEARYYKRIGKKLVFAARAMYGQFLGEGKKTYRVGGVDNWLINNTESLPSNSPLYYDDSQQGAGRNYSDLLFTPFVMPLRGFNYNRLIGEGSFLANVELRVPVLNYLSRGNITSNFIRNLQFVGFFDIGTAWNGMNPFSRDNSVNVREISQPNNVFYAKIYNFKSPFLMGYGAGLRSTILGVYTKLDMAWGVEDNKVLPQTRFYLTVGHDF